MFSWTSLYTLFDDDGDDDDGDDDDYSGDDTVVCL